MSKLEALLLDKNRKMEHELTQLKVCIQFRCWKLVWCSEQFFFGQSVILMYTYYLPCWNCLISSLYLLKVKISEKSNLLEEAENKIAELTSKVEEQQKLILKLEDDILKVALLAPVIIHILPIDPIVF